MINPKYRGICSQRLAKIRLESGEFERLGMGKGQKKEKPHFTRLEGGDAGVEEPGVEAMAGASVVKLAALHAIKTTYGFASIG